MKFVECKYEEITKKTRKGELYRLLVDFANSGLQCARVVEHNWAKPTHAQSSVIDATKRYGMRHIKCVQGDDGEVYLINTLLCKEF